VDVRVTAEGGESHDLLWEAGAEEAELTFLLRAPLAAITIDPEEYWLELDRKNNHSEVLFRVRPIFDWPKQRELLVALRGTAGGNAIDGNYLGLGVNLVLNENNNLLVIPIYGERTRLHNYQATWQWRQFLLPDLSLQVTLEKLGGTTLRGLGFQYTLLETDDVLVRPGIQFRYETVLSAGFVDRDGTPVYQPEGIANNIAYQLEAGLKPGVFYGNRVVLESVHSQPSYGSDYAFTSHRIDFLQSFTPGDSHLLGLTLVRGSVAGTPPLQKRHPLGGPELLRGYPRVIELSHEEIAAARLEYGFVFSRAIYGANAQTRRITGYLFWDVGRGWNNDETYQERPQRQDLGIGLELVVNMLRLVQFPVRFDIAYPVNDPEYRDPQYIFFGVFNF
jgi:hypothetical protein